jgi:glycosyltransferase involved in cell wall biosynthesis
VLLISYPFPPVGGAGVQRGTKFAKYLPRHGWDVSVLTVANPSVPVYDDSLLADVPADTVVRRARSWEPGYALKASVLTAGDGKEQKGGSARRLAVGSFRRLGKFLLQPDPQILWYPGAVAAGRRLLRELPHDAILATGPPFSTFLIGAALSRHARLPLVLDYRDEWGLTNVYLENKRLGPVSRYIQDRMQRRVVRAAAGLVATTRSSAEALAGVKRRAGGRAAVTWIYNGFDPDDFAHSAAADRPEDGRFRLAYTGTLWNLTDVGPLVAAVRRLSAEHPDLAAGLDLVFAGRRTGPQEEHLAALRGLPCRVVEHPYLDHTAAVALMRGAGALCLLLSDVPGAGRVVPAKLFEYMAAVRPILAIVPPGETWDLLDRHPGGRFVPADVGGIATWLAEAIRDHLAGRPRPADGWDASPYSRDNQAGQLARFLRSCAARYAGRPAAPGGPGGDTRTRSEGQRA